MSGPLITTFPHGQGKGVVKQKADRRGLGDGGLKTGRNVGTSFIDDPFLVLSVISSPFYQATD